MVNKAKIEERKEGRRAAVDIKVLISEVTAGEGSWHNEAFWEELIQAFPNEIARPVQQQEIKPMTEEQAKDFGQHTQLPYGQYKGERVDAVSLDYLIWLVDQSDSFRKELRRYIKSKRTQRELE